MENAIIIGVLLAVVSVGLFGIYYANTENVGRTYVPVITGMSTFAQGEANITITSLVSISLSAGNASSTSFVAEVTPTAAPTNIFDTFGDCTGCMIMISSAPTDETYGGVGAQNASLLAIIESNSNTFINLSNKLNASLPTGFTAIKITTAPFNTNTTPTGTNDDFARDKRVDLTFDSANSLTLTTGYQQILGNWSDGTGLGKETKYGIAAQFHINPYNVAAGFHPINFDFLASATS
jgi:hypothetical protein